MIPEISWMSWMFTIANAIKILEVSYFDLDLEFLNEDEDEDILESFYSMI